MKSGLGIGVRNGAAADTELVEIRPDERKARDGSAAGDRVRERGPPRPGTIRPIFERIFDDPAAMRLWFANLITYSEALTLAGRYGRPTTR